MADPVEFQPEITLSKEKALDLVAGCDEMLSFTEASGELELAFTVEGDAPPGVGNTSDPGAAWCRPGRRCLERAESELC